MSTVMAMWAAVLLDAWLGEPRGLHPLVAFGRFAGWIEQRLYADRRASGLLAWMLTVLPVVLIAAAIQPFVPAWLAWSIRVLILYLAVGMRSLGEHARPVADALAVSKLEAARDAVARMVSRDSAVLTSEQVAVAATESVLENGNDAVFGALFWFAVLGAPGALLYRLANTLDAMWGYRSARYERFGWAAARLDDMLNLIPARLTALTYALVGNFDGALRCWRTQAARWDSPNAGPVMAAGAGALGVQLGGAAPYHGVWEARPPLGEGQPPDAASIRRAWQLVRHGVVLWLIAALLLATIGYGGRHA